jgi:hypothetical protein
MVKSPLGAIMRQRLWTACAVFFAHLLVLLFPSIVTLVPSDGHTRFDVAPGVSPLGFL